MPVQASSSSTNRSIAAFKARLSLSMPSQAKLLLNMAVTSRRPVSGWVYQMGA